MDGPTQASSSAMRSSPVRFEDIYVQCYRDVLRSVLPIVDRLAIAEEITQDAFEVAGMKWPTVVKLDRPDLWVRRVALNKALSVRRRSWRERLVASTPDDRPDDAPWSSGSSAVLVAVRGLPRRQMEIVVLVHFGGLRVAEAARALDISDSAARTHHSRALETLASKLGDDRADVPSREPGVPSGERR